MRRNIFLIALVLLPAILVFAAGEQEGGEEQITITVWDFKYGEVDGMQPAMQEIDRQFMEKHPNIKIEHEAQPNNEYYNIIRAAVTSGEGPDVVMFHGGPLAYQFDEFQVNLDPYIEEWRDEVPDFTWAKASRDIDPSNGVKVIPLTNQGGGYYYNKEMFREAGLDPDDPPSDWDEFLAAAEALDSAGITPILYGRPKSPEFFYRTTLPNIHGPEGAEAYATGERTFDDPGFRQATEMMVEIRDRGYFDREGYSMTYFMETRDAFMAGKGAMVAGLISDVAHWKDFSDALGAENVGYFPSINVPGAPHQDMQHTQGVGIGYAVMSWSENVDAAAEYAMYYGRGEGAKTLMEMTGAMPANTALDIGEFGDSYPVLEDILGYMRGGTTDIFAGFVPGPIVRDVLPRMADLLIVAEEITVDEYVDRLDREFAEAR